MINGSSPPDCIYSVYPSPRTRQLSCSSGFHTPLPTHHCIWPRLRWKPILGITLQSKYECRVQSRIAYGVYGARSTQLSTKYYYLFCIITGLVRAPQPLHSKIEEIEAVNQSQFDDLPFQIIKCSYGEYPIRTTKSIRTSRRQSHCIAFLTVINECLLFIKTTIHPSPNCQSQQ